MLSAYIYILVVNKLYPVKFSTQVTAHISCRELASEDQGWLHGGGVGVERKPDRIASDSVGVERTKLD